MQSAVLAGMWHPDQLALMEPWIEPYFDVVGRLWQERPGEIAQNAVLGLYPSLLVRQDILDRTDAYLAADGVPGPLARLLLESRDGVARCLRAQAMDAAAAASRS